jgi:hypothetical protein
MTEADWLDILCAAQFAPRTVYLKKMTNNFRPPHQLVPELSPRTERAIQRALQAAPEQRPASCREFMAELIG